MISEKTWANWLEAFEEYRKQYYPNIKAGEEEIIKIMFESLVTIYMEQLIIDIEGFRNK